jgi:hypothetical protein
MANKPNRLLLTLSALGIAAGINVSEAKADTATYDSFGEFFSYAGATFSRDLNAKLDFVRAYPQSPAAQRMATAISREITSMPAAEQRAVMDEIAATGGLPASVANATSIAGLSTAAVGPASRPRGLDVARANTRSVTNASIY